MGRYPSIAADKQKTGAARGKLYAMYAKEIYSAAKKVLIWMQILH